MLTYKKMEKILNEALKKTVGVNQKEMEESLFNAKTNKTIDGNMIIMSKLTAKKVVKQDEK